MASVSDWMGYHFSKSISVDSPLNDTLNRGPLVQLLRRQYEFPFGINIVQFSFLYFKSQRDLKYIEIKNGPCNVSVRVSVCLCVCVS